MNATTTPSAEDGLDSDACWPRLLGTCVLFLVYCLVVAYYMQDALRQRDKARAELKLERIHCEWLQRRLRDNEYGDAPPVAIEHMVRPSGPSEPS